jgi:two-component system sensor histidine kinase KdpD
MGDRGPLRVYLRAAPSVGKTYAMLNEAHRRLERGTDVVVGLVETHGREKTAALVDGLDVLPRTELTYRGRRVPATPSAGRTCMSCWRPGSRC